MVFSSIILPSAIGFGATFLISVAIVLTKSLHGSLSLDESVGVQKFHSAPTPRIGGIALAGGFFVTWFFMPDGLQRIWALIGLAGVPALAFGLIEDFTKRVSALWRMLATIFAGLLFCIATGTAISSVDIWGIDALLAIPTLSLAFTAIGIAGVANSFNIIDGFHGLASGTLVIILLSFAIVGLRIGDDFLVFATLVMAAIVAGFLVVNFPLGKLFLGDGGAYFAGFVVAVLAVMLPSRNPEVSPWISMLILAYPITEIMVSIFRRFFSEDGSPSMADSNHLHHAIHRSLSERVAHAFELPKHKNPLTGFLMWMMPMLTLIVVIFCGLDSSSAIGFLALFVVVYLIIYRDALGREVVI